MRKRYFLPISAAVAILLSIHPVTLPGAGGKSGTTNPDFTQGDSIPEGATHDWNLGPTGARGWMYSNRLETSEARQVYITKVTDGSPADGVLKVGDVILGMNEPFSYDPRTGLGKAIGKAEATDGALSLIRWRDGKTETVVLDFPVLGAYSPTAPFDCPKSKRILEQGCEALAKTMKANPNAGNGIVRSLNALALLASGDPDYLPLVREQVEWAAQYSDRERRTLHSWFYGPAAILVAEYSLATGDKTFLPDLERLSLEIASGQSAVGSWGHRFVLPGDKRLQGYGMMNSPGIPLTIALILARQAGVENPEVDTAIEKSLRLVRFYVGKGSVPYGDHHPWIQTHEDNGKNGMAAVMFNLAGEVEAAEYFSRMCVASHGAEREMGHTGNFFNMLWAMPGVALSGPQATGAWMEEFGWYYDLARQWDGTFLHQGPPAKRPDKYHGWDTTGAYLLAYAQPLRKIHLTRKSPSLAEQVDAAKAASLIEDGHGWSPRLKHASYDKRSEEQLLAGLESWSPVVRERSALELANRDGDPMAHLTRMLENGDLYSQLGACQAMIALGKRAESAVPDLRKTLKADDLWLRVKAAEALASIGDAAMVAVPELLSMLAETDPKKDPRGMEERYLSFALFQGRGGLLKNSLEGVDRKALYEAVRVGLRNEDGRARGAIGSVYDNLTYQEIEPLLPAIHRAVVEPAPSGVMFADGIRLSGLEVLAKHRIEEGIPLCLEVMEIERWGKQGRIAKCLKALQIYGGAAKSMLPELAKLEKQLLAHREVKSLQSHIELVRETTDFIQNDEDPPDVRPL